VFFQAENVPKPFSARLSPDSSGEAYGVRRSPRPPKRLGRGPSPFSSTSTHLQCSICRRGWQGLTPPLDEDDRAINGSAKRNKITYRITQKKNIKNANSTMNLSANSYNRNANVMTMLNWPVYYCCLLQQVCEIKLACLCLQCLLMIVAKGSPIMLLTIIHGYRLRLSSIALGAKYWFQRHRIVSWSS